MQVDSNGPFGSLHDFGDICDGQAFMVSQDKSCALFAGHGLQSLVHTPLGLAGNCFLIRTGRIIRQLPSFPFVIPFAFEPFPNDLPLWRV
jgi:hypothetical protein